MSICLQNGGVANNILSFPVIGDNYHGIKEQARLFTFGEAVILSALGHSPSLLSFSYFGQG